MQIIYLHFGTGNIVDGFTNVNVQFYVDNTIRASFRGSLPPNEKLHDSYHIWHKLYLFFCEYRNYTSRIKVQKKEVIRLFSLDDFKSINDTLRDEFNQWLSSASFSQIERRLRESIDQRDNVRIIVQTDDLILAKLPWNSWELIERYPNIELAFSNLDFEGIAPIQHNKIRKRRKVKILVVIGDSTNIHALEDRILLSNVSNACCEFLHEPSFLELHQKLSSESWDIFFFAGHSQTIKRNDKEEGLLYLNDSEQLTISDITFALKDAVVKGLQLAIFNSCDGLGLSRELLAHSSIPYSIVMRELVPDKVANQFLDSFLTSFSSGLNLHLAVRKAQESLQALHSEFPYIGSLPAIFQSLNAPNLTWNSFLNNGNPNKKTKLTIVGNLILNRRSFSILTLFLGSIVVSVGVSFASVSKYQSLYSKNARSQYLINAQSQWENSNFSSRISNGNAILIRRDSNPNFIKGTKYYNSSNYSQAAKLFLQEWKQNRSNPEALMYYHNSLAHERGVFYTLAVVVPATGNPQLANEILRGVAMAQQAFNQQVEVNKPLLKIVIADDGNNPEQAKEIAEILGNNKQILGVIGHSSSSATKAAIVIYEAANLPLISPTSSSNSLNSRIFFRTSPSSSAKAEELGNYIKSNRLNKVAIFASDSSAYSQQLKADFTKYLLDSKIDIVNQYDLSDSDLNPALELAHIAYQKKADSVVILPDATNKYLALELIEANGELPKENQLSLVGSDILYSYDTLTTSGMGVENLTITTPWFGKSENNSFAKKSSELWGGSVSWRTAASYDATQVLIDNLRPNISRSEVLGSLHSTELLPTQTSGRLIAFTPDGDITEKPPLLRVTKCKDAEITYCFTLDDTKN